MLDIYSGSAQNLNMCQLKLSACLIMGIYIFENYVPRVDVTIKNIDCLHINFVTPKHGLVPKLTVWILLNV